MFRLFVRSRKDASAVSAMVSRFYRGWGVSVESLGGVRGDKLVEKIVETVKSHEGFSIVLLGREDVEAARRTEALLPPTSVVHVVPRARVRNARLEMLYLETLKARARLRMLVSWDSGRQIYRLDLGGVRLEAVPIEPSVEAFPGLGAFHRVVGSLAGAEVGRDPLVVRTSSGRHLVYNGPRVRAQYVVSDAGFRPSASVRGDVEPLDNDWRRVAVENSGPLRAVVAATKGFLEAFDDYDTVVVPWSGGKDSTAALLLALEVFGRNRVRVVYGDTGTEFPQSREYVEETARRLGIDYVVAYAGLDKAILEEGMPMPSHGNRWCTGRKVEAIERTVRSISEGKTLLVVGDRDAESVARSERPPVRKGVTGDFTVVAPLKLWSGLHVVLYMLARGVTPNPLYELGFYRIGCYMCPALRDWELNILLRNTPLYVRLVRSPIFRRFVHSRLYRGRGDEKA